MPMASVVKESIVGENKPHLYLVGRMEEKGKELEIVDRDLCGDTWDGISGTRYIIRVGENDSNKRVAFNPHNSLPPLWVKKEFEEQALALMRYGFTEEVFRANSHMFDTKNIDSALCKLLGKEPERASDYRAYFKIKPYGRTFG